MLKNEIPFHLQALVEGMALKDILIQHLSKDPERRTRVVEVNEAMMEKVFARREVLEARRLIRCNLSECCSGVFQSCSLFFFLSRLLVALLFFLFLKFYLWNLHFTDKGSRAHLS